jgi:hypothetical protein
MDYKRDSVVDKNKIDKEILEHGQRYMDYAEASAEAEEEKSLAKQRAGLMRAKVTKEIRSKPNKYKLKDYPPTVVEKLIKDLVELDPRVKKADRKHFRAIKNASILASAAHTMGSYKKQSIQLYAEMTLRGFFSEPRIKLDSEDYAKVWKKKKRERSIKQRKLLRKRR